MKVALLVSTSINCLMVVSFLVFWARWWFAEHAISKLQDERMALRRTVRKQSDDLEAFSQYMTQGYVEDFDGRVTEMEIPNGNVE